MKNNDDSTKKLQELLRKPARINMPAFPDADDPIAVLVQSFLLWEASTKQALRAYDKMMTQVVDFNDLRICLPGETVEMLGSRYPEPEERCERLRAALRDVYLREHKVSLDRASEMNKRDARRYLETLDGIVPYVTSRVMLLSFSAHAIPVDHRLHTRLVKVGIVEHSMSLADLETWLTRQIKAADAHEGHVRLQAWAEAGGKTTTGNSSVKNSDTRENAGKKSVKAAS